MDADRFDSLAKRLVTPTTRRASLGTALAGGLLGALGLGGAAPEVRAAQGGLCVIAFVATVRQGPSANRSLVAGGAPGELRGNMRFSLSGSGNLQNADLLLDDGSSLPVVGQATGHGFQARITFGQGRALVAVGVGEQDVTRCLGPLDGPATGPEVGDLGEWHAAAGVQNLPGGAGGTGGGDTRTGGSGGSTGGSSGGGESGQACPRGQTRCGDACVDLQTDPLHCGQCGLPCASELGAGACIAGECACSSGTTRCDDVCVNTKRDPLNCGGCGTACTDGGECLEGACAAAQTACPLGQTRCGDACVDTTSDAANCSACGVACAADERCSGSLCVPINGGGGCKTGLTPCGPTCANVQTDANNCGRCGNACPAGEGCVNGTCELATRVCVDPGESCADGDCCIGFCDQDDLCQCVSEGAECAQTGTGGCCSGQPCNADGFCGTCTLFGASCTADAECCSGSQYGAGLCCAGVCTDVTNIGFACPCAQLGESCTAVDCCVGFCGQDDLCDCASDGRECRSNDECCNGVCNANGFCGTCGLLGANCITAADCCSGNYAVDCCLDGGRLTTLCTDVTDTGLCPGLTADEACAPVFGSCGVGMFCDLDLLRCSPCRTAGGSCSLGAFVSGAEACCTLECNGTCT